MNTEIQTFNFNNATMRTLTDENGEPWFVAKDACNILGIDTNHLRETLDDDEITNLRNPEVWNQPGRAPLIISEPGLYKLIMRSRKPEAKEFKRWVTHEVLPSIRKHGIYATETTIDQILTNPDFGIRLLTDLKEERAKRIEAENHVKELEPKAKGTGRLHQRTRHPTHQGRGETPLQRRHANRRKRTTRMAQLTRLDIPTRRNLECSFGTSESRTLGHSGVKNTRTA